MKKIILLIRPVLFLSLFICGCKKEKEPGGRSYSTSSFSFKYNGKQYNLGFTSQGVQDWGAWPEGLYINRPDIFGGIIRFFSNPACGYREPYESAVVFTGNCLLTDQSGMPVDSVVVYFYQNSSYSFSYSNCESKQGYDVVTGSNYTYRLCDGSGTFSLELKNKNNEHISITNGVIKEYNVRLP